MDLLQNILQRERLHVEPARGDVPTAQLPKQLQHRLRPLLLDRVVHVQTGLVVHLRLLLRLRLEVVHGLLEDVLDDQLVLLLELHEGAPGALAVGDWVVPDPAVAGVRVEVVAGVNGGVHRFEDVAGYVDAGFVEAG